MIIKYLKSKGLPYFTRDRDICLPYFAKDRDIRLSYLANVCVLTKALEQNFINNVCVALIRSVQLTILLGYSVKTINGRKKKHLDQKKERLKTTIKIQII